MKIEICIKSSYLQNALRFLRGWPASDEPPCSTPRHPSGGTNLDAWMTAQKDGFNPCMGWTLDQYDPISNEDGLLCSRNHPWHSQHCWGVCLDDDTLEVAADGSSKMRQAMVRNVEASVREIEGLLRARNRVGNLTLARGDRVAMGGKVIKCRPPSARAQKCIRS
jgi:hypothetical protein